MTVNHFLSFLNFLLNFVNNISSHYSYIILFSLFITTDDSCYNDYHCINKSWLCPSGLVVRCITRQCKCITILNPIDFVST
ncbi:Nodule Cysteine-Rich (NCR) secreted peptide [Medicago truncatula]|uniref:Nodule Cysteine-Rich (NCR) secreted peptide n=1 Tax=Medicago truncatula TaxID=3880 RepID=A0A072UZ22_MEDTR|nr:Nodule Cysteine-Rich (NCR) secreted peptide [Medicago truncatula]